MSRVATEPGVPEEAMADASADLGGAEGMHAETTDREPMHGRGSRSGAWRWIRLVVQLALTAAVTWFILQRVGLSAAEVSRLSAEAWRPDWLILAGASALLLAGYLLSAVLWGRMVWELGGPRLSAGDACRVYFTANLGRYVPGKVWQIAGTAYLSRAVGVPASLGTGAAILGQGMALAGATLVGSVAFFAGGPATRTLGTWALAGAAALVVVVSLPDLFRWGVKIVFGILKREAPKRAGWDHRFGLRWLIFYTLNWMVYAFSFWALVQSFHLGGGIVDVASAFAAAYVLGYLAFFAPAGIGVREGFLVAFLGPLLAGGAGVAAAVAVIARLWTTVVELIPAGAFGVSMARKGGSEQEVATKQRRAAEQRDPTEQGGGV